MKPLFLALAALLAATPAAAQTAGQPAASVRYRCDGGKTLTADYYNGPTRSAPDGRPIPGGRVDLVLADGLRLSLPQTLSGSGIRYADASESVVFWSKGDTAFLDRPAQPAAGYANCVATRP